MQKSKTNFKLIKWAMFFAAAVLIILLLPMTASAAEHYEDEEYTDGTQYYVDTASGEYWVVSNGTWHQCELYDDSDDLELVTTKIRSAMLNRDSGISFYFVTANEQFSENVDSSLSGSEYNEASEALTNEYIPIIFDIIEDGVYEATDNPASGDYLELQCEFYDGGSYRLTESSKSEDYTFFYINVKISSRTTAAQEQQVKNYVEEWNREYIDSNSVISSASDDDREYYIVKTIYNFITKNTIYYTDLYNDTDHSVYPVDGDDYIIAHTAYGALFGNIDGSYDADFQYVEETEEATLYYADLTYYTDGQGLYRINKMNQGRAVCDGYSLLFYYLCEYNGIDCKIISGDYDSSSGLNSDPHAWNMVSLKDCYDTDYEWYAIDTTFGSQRTQKVSDDFTAVSYDFFLRGSEDEAFDASTHQVAYDEYSDIISGQSVENYRFKITNIDPSNINVFVSRRRTEDESEKYVSDGVYNLENYLIIDPDGNYYKINSDKDGLEESEGFTYYSTGYWYSFELYDFAEGIEYECEDIYLLDAGTYTFDVTTMVDNIVYSKEVTIAPLDMSDLSSYDMSLSTVNGEQMSETGNIVEDLSIVTEYTATSISLSTEIYDSSQTELVEGTDYEFYCYVSGDTSKTAVTPKEPNSYVICIEYKGNYTGTFEIPFEIEKTDLSHIPCSTFEVTYGNDIASAIKSVTLGDQSTGEVTQLTVGTDFEIVSVDGGTDYGDDGEITVKALSSSSYLKADSVGVWDYKISKQRDLTSLFSSTTNIGTYDYTGSEIKPTDFKLYRVVDGEKVLLVLNTDYVIDGYEDNVNAGTATINVTFTGNYTGTAKFYFTIVKSASSSAVPKDYTISKLTFTYNGKVQRPSVTIKDSNGRQMVYKTDFTVDYSNWNSTNAGTYTMTVSFKGDYAGCDSYSVNYTIKAKTTLPTIKLNRTTITYTGTVQRPSVTVKDGSTSLTYKTDFTVSYSNINSKAVGRYTLTVKMIGNYSGSKTYTYYINPKSTTISSVTAGTKSFTVKWNKQTNNTTGYQIQYATKSDFSNAATIYAGASSATSKTVTGRASKAKYYVRIRTYKNVGGKYFYSDWSSAKTVTTK